MEPGPLKYLAVVVKTMGWEGSYLSFAGDPHYRAKTTPLVINWG